MVSLTTAYLCHVTRRNLIWYLGAKSAWRQPLLTALRSTGKTIPLCLFGGAVRDIAIYGKSAKPFDIDLVASDVSIDELASALHQFVERRTIFGGLKLAIAGTNIDIWPLHDTWSFKSTRTKRPSFSALPGTTFLNVEAIAVELTQDCLNTGRIYTKGFFKGIADRVVNINNLENPFPRRAVQRSLALAKRLNFAVGPELAGQAAELLHDSSPQGPCADIAWSSPTFCL